MGEVYRNVPGAGQGYPIEGILIELEIYRLLCIFCSSHDLHKLSTGGENDDLDSMRQKFEETEACRLLISIAIMLRSITDTTPSHTKLRLGEQEPVVGTLQPDIENNETKTTDLMFRNACNKIAHADHINFDMAEDNPEKMSYINPTVYLYGELHEKQWKASVNVIEFARIAYCLC